MSEALEIGGNVFELIEFTLERHLSSGINIGRYGVNVAKVREVVRMPMINPLASRVRGLAGLFELRGIPIPAINLAAALGDEVAPLRDDQQIIVCEFSQKRAGFIVNATQRIRRITWDRVLPPAADKQAGINGMTLVENNEFLFILDLEKILFDIEVATGHASFKDANLSLASNASKRGQKGRILLVEDSEIILNNAKYVLERDGYSVVCARNGLEAKSFIENLSKDSDGILLIVSDVEMPKMDGLSLTRWIRSTPAFSNLPVVLHSSLAGETNQEAGKLVGANRYIVKNDFAGLLRAISELLGS